jgi:hypothetical protein
MELVQGQVNEVTELKSTLDTISTLVQELTNAKAVELSNVEAQVAQLIQQHFSGQHRLVPQSGFDDSACSEQDDFFMELLRKHFPTVAEEKFQELHRRATSIKEDVEERLFKRVIVFLESKQSGGEADPQDRQPGENIKSDNHKPTEEATKDGGGQPPPDDEDLDMPGGYAGYKHLKTYEKSIAFTIREHRHLRATGFAIVRDFDSLTAAAQWLSQRELFPPMHHIRRDNPPMYQNNSPDSETARINAQHDEIQCDIGSMYSPDGYYGYNERGLTGQAYWINERGEKEHLPHLPPNMKMAGRRVPNTKACDAAYEDFSRQDHYNKYGPSPSNAHNWTPLRQPDTNSFHSPHQQRFHHQFDTR